MNPLSPKPLSRPVRHITLSRGLWLWILPGEVVQWMTWETLNSDPNRSISPVRITALYLCEDNSGVGLQLFMIEPCYYHWECFPPHSFLPWTWRFGGIWELKNNNWKSGIMTWRIDFRIHLFIWFKAYILQMGKLRLKQVIYPEASIIQWSVSTRLQLSWLKKITF